MPIRHVHNLLPRVAAHAALLCLLALSASMALAASAMVNVDIAPGTFKSIRLKTLPAGTVVDVQIESTGSIFIAMVNTKGYVSSSRPLFMSQLNRKLSFTVTIPELDDYYLVLDNRKGADNRSVSIAFQATAPSKKDPQKKSNRLTS